MAGTLTLKAKNKRTIEKLVDEFFNTPSKICPEFDATEYRIILRCKSRQIAARIRGRRAKRVLQVDELLGPPLLASDAQPPKMFYPPRPLGLGGPCPGDTNASKAECSIQKGKLEKAAKLLQKALKEQPAYAALRLGDLALGLGDVETAAAWYKRAGYRGPFGRLAKVRLCELNGTCFDDHRHRYRYLDSTALPSPLKEEMVLRAARLHVFAGRPLQAASFLLSTGLNTRSDNLCKFAIRLCHRIALEGLRASQIEPSADALALFMALPNRLDGPHAFELTDLAASTAEELGAEAFAASLLASSTAVVPKSLAADQLFRTARLFVAAGDVARARIVLRFALEKYRHRPAERIRYALLEAKLDEDLEAEDARLAALATDESTFVEVKSEDDDAFSRAEALLSQSRALRSAPLYPPLPEESDGGIPPGDDGKTASLGGPK
ncbi:MAG: tetratricopeptide repeat protein [Deltaproteobacteria bacterium]|nr:tetratricopeptide repeat protein [Deltaproteobacteria bacterium]